MALGLRACRVGCGSGHALRLLGRRIGCGHRALRRPALPVGLLDGSLIGRPRRRARPLELLAGHPARALLELIARVAQPLVLGLGLGQSGADRGAHRQSDGPGHQRLLLEHVGEAALRAAAVLAGAAHAVAQVLAGRAQPLPGAGAQAQRPLARLRRRRACPGSPLRGAFPQPGSPGLSRLALGVRGLAALGLLRAPPRLLGGALGPLGVASAASGVILAAGRVAEEARPLVLGGVARVVVIVGVLFQQVVVVVTSSARPAARQDEPSQPGADEHDRQRVVADPGAEIAYEVVAVTAAHVFHRLFEQLAGR